MRQLILQLEQDNFDLTKALEDQRSVLSDREKETKQFEKKIRLLNEKYETLQRSSQSYESQKRQVENEVYLSYNTFEILFNAILKIYIWTTFINFLFDFLAAWKATRTCPQRTNRKAPFETGNRFINLTVFWIIKFQLNCKNI